MALISTQRVEFITSKLLEQLINFDKDVYGITTTEFLEYSTKSKNAIKTLGTIFKLLKLNPKLVIEDELNDYLRKRNLFIHKFWELHLNTKSEAQAKSAIDFCQDFGRHSARIMSFFKGMLYLLALHHQKEIKLAEVDTKIPIVRDITNWFENDLKNWNSDFEYFMQSLKNKKLLDK